LRRSGGASATIAAKNRQKMKDIHATLLYHARTGPPLEPLEQEA
jgi:hypothetical protein